MIDLWHARKCFSTDEKVFTVEELFNKVCDNHFRPVKLGMTMELTNTTNLF